MTGRLSDRRALVTGAADGIGEATARLFAAEGARVLAVDVAADKLAAAWKGVAGVTPFAIDIAAEGASRHIIEAASASLGALDIATPGGMADTLGWYTVEGNQGYAPGAGGLGSRYFADAASLTPAFVAATVNKYLGRPGAVVAVEPKKTENTSK